MRSADPADDIEPSLSPEVVLPSELDQLRELCRVQDGCWLFPKNGAFPCRPPGNDSMRAQLPQHAPHRWAWLVANGRFNSPLPPKIGVRRRCHYESGCEQNPARCPHSRCCNPDHLFITSSNGVELSIEEADQYAIGERSAALVYEENLDDMKSKSTVTPDGCWLAPTAGPVPCRCDGDDRPDGELPKMAAHRWTWSIANGYADRPFSGTLIKVRHRCGNGMCCQPDHLFLASSNGKEITTKDAEALIADRLLTHDDVEPALSTSTAEPALGTPPEAGMPSQEDALPPDESDTEVDHPPLQESPPGDRQAHLLGALQRSGSVFRDAFAKIFRSTDSEESESAPGTRSANVDRIRDSYRDWIAANYPGLDSDSQALSLAVFPWPNWPLKPATIAALVAEMHPTSNLRHPDAREVASDRLERLADVASFLNEDGLADVFRFAAEALQESIRTTSMELATYGAVTDPLGLGPEVGPHGLAASRPPSPDGPLPPIDVATVATLLNAVARARSRDLGIVLGEAAIGVDLRTVVARRPNLSVIYDLDRFLTALDDRTREIAVERLFNIDRPPTLEELGTRWGITRERVRQILRAVDESIELRFSPDLEHVAPMLAALAAWVMPTRRLLDALELLTSDLENSAAVAVALLTSSGPWTHEEGWTVNASQAGSLAASVDALMETSDGYGSVRDDDIELHLGHLFMDAKDRDAYVRQVLGMVEMQGLWSLRGSQRNRVATALRSLGRPATKKEIGDVAGVSDVARVGSVLASLSGVVRADKERWAFAGWVDDPYDGIVGEIDQRIDEHGGAVRVDLLFEEIPRLFGVSESSIRTYLATDAYTVERGMVRYNASDYDARPPSSRSRAVLLNNQWGQRVQLYDRHFVGYSLAVSFDVAFANGVRPGDDLLVPVVGHDTKASVIWRRHSPNRTVHVGRLSELLEDLGCQPGDEVIVVPTCDSVLVTAEAGSDSPHRDLEDRSADDVSDGKAGQRPSRPLVEPSTYAADGPRDPLLDLLGDG